jgi:phosphate transport system protein
MRPSPRVTVCGHNLCRGLTWRRVDLMTMHHTSRDFDAELRELRANLLAMGARCERSVQIAVETFVEESSPMTKDVIDLDRRINRDEMEIDELALRIIALRQPVAYDLRLITTALKLVTDLERIGDEAVNIAERAEEAKADQHRAPTGTLRKMADLAEQMLRDALDAFVESDIERATRVRSADDAVDELYGEALREMMDFMASHLDQIPAAVRAMSVAKYLERIADHATNIAEEVIFMVAGQDVRHRSHPPRPLPS